MRAGVETPGKVGSVCTQHTALHMQQGWPSCLPARPAPPCIRRTPPSSGDAPPAPPPTLGCASPLMTPLPHPRRHLSHPPPSLHLPSPPARPLPHPPAQSRRPPPRAPRAPATALPSARSAHPGSRSASVRCAALFLFASLEGVHRERGGLGTGRKRAAGPASWERKQPLPCNDCPLPLGPRTLNCSSVMLRLASTSCTSTRRPDTSASLRVGLRARAARQRSARLPWWRGWHRVVPVTQPRLACPDMH